MQPSSGWCLKPCVVYQPLENDGVAYRACQCLHVPPQHERRLSYSLPQLKPVYSTSCTNSVLSDGNADCNDFCHVLRSVCLISQAAKRMFRGQVRVS
jgi:hypothetical protein